MTDVEHSEAATRVVMPQSRRMHGELFEHDPFRNNNNLTMSDVLRSLDEMDRKKRIGKTASSTSESSLSSVEYEEFPESQSTAEDSPPLSAQDGAKRISPEENVNSFWRRLSNAASPIRTTSSPTMGRRYSREEGMLSRLRRAVTHSAILPDSIPDTEVPPMMRRPRSMKSDPPVVVRETNVIDKAFDHHGNKIINNYIMTETVGQGRHGKVKRCLDMNHGTTYAMKIVKKTAKKRFGVRETSPAEKIRTEIAILKKCDHPNVVKLVEVLDNPEHYKVYLVLEFMEGGAVQWRNNADEPLLDEEQSRRYFRDVLLGLEYLHYQGIVHRDIKPANLLLTGDNHVKISDFGVSYITEGDDQNEAALSKTEGTPYFLAPELCPSEDPGSVTMVGKAIDVWALGVTLYCFLTGTLPFLAQHEYELYGVIRSQEPTYPSGLSEDARDLIQQTLIKDPLARPTLATIKRHPWVVAGISDVEAWLRDTDPAHKDAISVTQEDVTNAFTLMEKIRVQMRRLSASVSNLMQRRSRSSSMEEFNKGGASPDASPRSVPSSAK